MIETFNKIINNQSFERIESLLITKSKVIYLEKILHYKDSINQLIHELES